ncbi:Peptidase M50B-like [Paenibacillus sophorae]|uniref:M50 family metallopeptidase n=1 Tax=Paenibacillus sophorae TaxID=1333845 RepID=A0A1H8TA83_9BACL|nr:M50 family metallopeptidase [Paenibacillus sophorae]QWU17161.1 M50 family metallopeptidase [Paenibacillus sophorae]SEO87705.1 Peptidase M50B-like [Paenibacillus sophorae]
MNNWLKTILFLVGSVLLTRWIPFSSLFRNLDTMIHEFGHALVTLLLSGQVLRIELYADHSGVTYSAVQAGFRPFLVSLAGYPSASLFALLLFYLYARGRKELGLILSSGIALIMLALYVRGGFGMLWLAGFAGLNIVMLLTGKGIRKFYYLLLAFLTLEESVVGTLYLVTASAYSPSRAGDAANLARLTGIPAILWAILFFLFSLLCAKWALESFFRSPRPYRESQLRQRRMK